MICHLRATILMRKINDTHENGVYLPDHQLLEKQLRLPITLGMLAAH